MASSKTFKLLPLGAQSPAQPSSTLKIRNGSFRITRRLRPVYLKYKLAFPRVTNAVSRLEPLDMHRDSPPPRPLFSSSRLQLKSSAKKLVDKLTAEAKFKRKNELKSFENPSTELVNVVFELAGAIEHISGDMLCQIFCSFAVSTQLSRLEMVLTAVQAKLHTKTFSKLALSQFLQGPAQIERLEKLRRKVKKKKNSANFEFDELFAEVQRLWKESSSDKISREAVGNYLQAKGFVNNLSDALKELPKYTDFVSFAEFVAFFAGSLLRSVFLNLKAMIQTQQNEHISPNAAARALRRQTFLSALATDNIDYFRRLSRRPFL